ncbi:hypothetical protein C1I99_23620 [Micromonospora deserti]|uniref:DUF11 domain-containing protein n=1 Tax=Micromonospora deserti TaxID=2070366 RepID=A0A2W2CSB5_9ACTN|nr:hypothetical protein C1I99_23620 [Micromonospora deserti]
MAAAPVLTSAPFGALPGQGVTHTVTLSGQGSVTAARVTFTTTADLGGVTARAEPGRCTASARTVVCDLGDLRLGASSAPRITITGTLPPDTPPGTLIRNRVSVTSAQSTADGVTSNAYLLPESRRTPSEEPRQESQPAASKAEPPGGSMGVAVVAALVVASVVAAGAVLARRRMRRRALPSAVTTGVRDPI